MGALTSPFQLGLLGHWERVFEAVRRVGMVRARRRVGFSRGLWVEGGRKTSGQPAGRGSPASRLHAAASSWRQGQVADSRRWSRRR